MSDPRSNTLMTWVAEVTVLFLGLLWGAAVAAASLVRSMIDAVRDGPDRGGQPPGR